MEPPWSPRGLGPLVLRVAASSPRLGEVVKTDVGSNARDKAICKGMWRLPARHVHLRGRIEESRPAARRRVTTSSTMKSHDKQHDEEGHQQQQQQHHVLQVG